MPNILRFVYSTLVAVSITNALKAEEVITYLPTETNQRANGSVYQVEPSPPQADEFHEIIEYSGGLDNPNNCFIKCRSDQKHNGKYYVMTGWYDISIQDCAKQVELGAKCDIVPGELYKSFGGTVIEARSLVKTWNVKNK